MEILLKTPTYITEVNIMYGMAIIYPSCDKNFAGTHLLDTNIQKHYSKINTFWFLLDAASGCLWKHRLTISIQYHLDFNLHAESMQLMSWMSTLFLCSTCWSFVIWNRELHIAGAHSICLWFSFSAMVSDNAPSHQILLSVCVFTSHTHAIQANNKILQCLPILVTFG